ncbi:Mov34/MPN/PAD-1 family protein [Georgenia muralis]|uniref:Integrative and conjugative element protein (TIGR02256 family) n=1 Tax=Georgenia muralis TaxID=154117 RepID=A0A3N5A5C7_9MICO|nr:Mov34/MPN/PAD-1 family protein [Georgenia muralis]RPF28565.1 integrative and conjugative element protein (TIGR02256 family) [Georgenia muralis]
MRQTPVVLTIEPAAAATLTSEASRAFPMETGGVLMGWELGGRVHIHTVVGPGPAAVHRPAAFHPDSEWQEGEIARIYAESGRRVSYLGDWHTHPRGSTRMSLTDRGTLLSIANHAAARCPNAVMLILAGMSNKWSLGAFRVERVPLLLGIAVTTVTAPVPQLAVWDDDVGGRKR